MWCSAHSPLNSIVWLEAIPTLPRIIGFCWNLAARPQRPQSSSSSSTNVMATQVSDKTSGPQWLKSAEVAKCLILDWCIESLAIESQNVWCDVGRGFQVADHRNCHFSMLVFRFRAKDISLNDCIFCFLANKIVFELILFDFISSLKARYTLAVLTGRVHGWWCGQARAPVNTGRKPGLNVLEKKQTANWPSCVSIIVTSTTTSRQSPV